MTCLIVLLAGCTTQPLPAPPASVPAPLACVPTPEPSHKLGATAAVSATRAYHKAELGIAPAITGKAATVSYIKEVETADKLARQALRLLVAQDGHPTPDAIGEARRSIDQLVAVLVATPQQE